MKITLYGRQSNSGTFVFFRKAVLKADYSQKMNRMNGNAQIVEAIKNVRQVRRVDADKFASTLILSLDDAQSAIPEVVKNIVNAGGLVLSVKLLRPSLEEAYLSFLDGFHGTDRFIDDRLPFYLLLGGDKQCLLEHDLLLPLENEPLIG